MSAATDLATQQLQTLLNDLTACVTEAIGYKVSAEQALQIILGHQSAGAIALADLNAMKTQATAIINAVDDASLINQLITKNSGILNTGVSSHRTMMDIDSVAYTVNNNHYIHIKLPFLSSSNKFFNVVLRGFHPSLLINAEFSGFANSGGGGTLIWKNMSGSIPTHMYVGSDNYVYLRIGLITTYFLSIAADYSAGVNHQLIDRGSLQFISTATEEL